MATANSAVAIPALVLVLGLVLSAVSAGVDQIRCVDAARLAARAAARGDGPASVRALAAQAAPAGAVVTVSHGGERVHVVVTARRPLTPVSSLGFTVSASAEAAVEGASGAPP
ncbi:MAG TPA: TadE family type IV pilus minor pilin [Candidatus Lustribacter sp.]|nr:TadE family type IV pilus minor pilin [Candidatus Lustribacter sp.]